LYFCACIGPDHNHTSAAADASTADASDDKDDVVRITTNLVQVDAVRNEDGKPVRNLTAEDFEVFEDGRKQTITSFAYISNVAGVPSQPVTAVREKGTDVVPLSTVNAMCRGASWHLLSTISVYRRRALPRCENN
jgi:hypothetical protein